MGPPGILGKREQDRYTVADGIDTSAVGRDQRGPAVDDAGFERLSRARTPEHAQHVWREEAGLECPRVFGGWRLPRSAHA